MQSFIVEKVTMHRLDDSIGRDLSRLLNFREPYHEILFLKILPEQ